MSSRDVLDRSAPAARLETPPVARRPVAARTLPELLRASARSPAAELCGLRFVDARERETLHSWREVAARAERCARSLAGAGVEAGDVVALCFPTAPEFFDAFFGTLACGAVPAPVYPPVRLGRMPEYEERTATMLRSAGVRLALVDARVLRLWGGVRARYEPPLGCRTLAALAETRAAHDAAAPVPAVLDDEALALVQFSSGTGDRPKPVALTHRALLEQARLLHDFFPDDEEVRHSGVSWLPLYHDMGLVGCVLPALMRPGDLTLLPPELFVARPALWLRALSRHRATISPAPNFAYALATQRPTDEELEGIDLSCWRVALDGAEAVSPEVLRAFARRYERYGFRAEALAPVYGLAEAALAVTFSELRRPFRSVRFDRAALAEGRAVPIDDEEHASAVAGSVELVSVGRPVPGFAIEIRGDDDALLDERQLGRVLVRGPSLFREYLGLPEETRRALRGGWLDTGDLGFVHGGELFLAGRAKDVLVVAGRKHAPEPVERAAAVVPGVRAGCVVAITLLPPGAEREELWLLVEVRRGTRRGEADLASLEQAVRARVVGATALRPDRVLLLRPGTLPRTSSGKLRRGEARRLALLGVLGRDAARSESWLRELAARPAVAGLVALARSRRLARRREEKG